MHTEDVFYEFNYGMLIGVNFSDEILEELNEEIVALHQDVEYMKDIRDKYIYDKGDCVAAENQHQLGFMNFLGLWILLFSAIGVAAIMLGVDIYKKWKKNKNG